MELKDSITASQTLALDTNILISAYNQSSRLGIKSIELLEKIKQVHPKVFISVLVFHEFLIKVYKKELEGELALYEDFITAGGSFTVVDLDRQIARRAAKIRAQYQSVRAPDAIHLASALEKNVKIFITTDRRLPAKIDNLIIKKLT